MNNNAFGMPMMGMMQYPMNPNMFNPTFIGPGMSMPMNIGIMGGGNTGMPMNIIDNEDWKAGFELAMNESQPSSVSEDNTPGPKMNVVFTTTTGTKRNLVLAESCSIDQALRKYLEVVGHSELYNQTEKIGFIYNAQKLIFGDTKTIKEFFNGSVNPKIIVNDTNNLIGA